MLSVGDFLKNTVKDAIGLKREYPLNKDSQNILSSCEYFNCLLLGKAPSRLSDLPTISFFLHKNVTRLSLFKRMKELSSQGRSRMQLQIPVSIFNISEPLWSFYYNYLIGIAREWEINLSQKFNTSNFTYTFTFSWDEKHLLSGDDYNKEIERVAYVKNRSYLAHIDSFQLICDSVYDENVMLKQIQDTIAIGRDSFNIQIPLFEEGKGEVHKLVDHFKNIMLTLGWDLSYLLEEGAIVFKFTKSDI